MQYYYNASGASNGFMIIYDDHCIIQYAHIQKYLRPYRKDHCTYEHVTKKNGLTIQTRKLGTCSGLLFNDLNYAKHTSTISYSC